MKNTITFSLFTFTFSLALCATAGGAKRIDFEHHYISTNYFNYCATRAAEQQEPWFDAEAKVMHFWYGDYDYSKCNYSENTLYTDLTDLGDKRMAEMDRAGIDVAVLSYAIQVDDLPADKALEIAKASNDDVYNAIQANPDRFMGAALLPVLQGEEAVKELERCVKTLGFKYWHVGSTILGPDGKTRHIWESEFEPLLAKAAELGVCIYLHPDYSPETDYWDIGSFAYGGPGMAFGMDVMQTATHLIMNGTFDKYPNLRVILGHMGEYLPYILDRMNFQMNLSSSAGAGFDTNNVTCTETLYHYVVTNANFVISTSGSADTNAFLCAKEALGADRIVFASDWPYENITNATKFIDTCELTDAEKDGVWSDNAAMYILHTTTPVSDKTLSPEDHVTTASLWQRDTDKDEWREVKFNTVSNCYEVLSNAEAKIVYQAEPGYYFADKSFYVERMLDATVSPVTVKAGEKPLPEVIEGYRVPDYASDDGHDWLFNHAIAGKEYEGEAAESSIDLFYVYPTLTSAAGLEYNGFRLIDDPEMRGDEVPSFVTAAGAFYGNARCFADMTHVYAPYYRQATLATAFDCATNGLGGVRSDANQRYLTALYEGPAYADVTNALETYFFKWNKGRKFMLAGHSQGSAILRLLMEKYFMQDDMHKALLKNLVASYQIGFGVSKAKMDEITAATGVTFATTSNDVGVVVSYNLFGPGATGNSVLLPDDAMAINPISWSRGTAPADKSLNLGAISQLTGEAIGAGLYGATVNADRGTVECAEFPASAYVGAEVFGEKSLHGQDYPAFWENLRVNNYVRGSKLAGFCKLCTTNFPAHLCVSNAYYTTKSDLSTKNWVEPVGGTVWIPTNNLHKATVYLVPEKGYRLFNGDFEMPCVTANLQNYLKDGEYLIPDNLLSTLNFKWIQRAPDYAAADGKDWLFHHDIAEKKYAGEPTDDPGVDLFYLYPTAVLVSNDHTVDNICDIDDAYLRSEEGALFAWKMSGEAFGDYTRVYAPYYRQTPGDFEMAFVHQGEYGVTNANDRMVEWWYDRAPYTDVTNALTHYFTVINPDQGGGKRRPFILAGHSHGSGMLRLVMERFFTNETQQAWLANMVACYAVGFGLGKDVEATIKEKAGVPCATNATDTGVYIFWNTQGAGVKPGEPAALWPKDPAPAVNPITWTREANHFAAAAKNLGAWTANDTGAIRPGLYDASNLVANGTIVCSSPDLADEYMSESWGFGENSLHRWDYKAYWDNIRANGLQRIQTWKDAHDVAKHSQIPLIGQPIDYGDAFYWVTNSITATGVTKDVDALFFYPTLETSGDSTFMPVTDAHKAQAYDWCADKVTAFEDYANIIMPAYRQMNFAAVTAGQTLYPTGSEFFDFLRRTLSRTDLFAALDEYFTNINPGGKRPFFLAGHSQGSSQIKVLLLDYFTRDANKTKLDNLVAAYALGYSFDAKWIKDLGVDLKAATGATGAKVVVAWNTEGPNAVEHSFVVEDGAIAINPMNWTTTTNVWSETTPDAMIQQRFGYADGTYVLVTTNSTEFVPPAGGMGEKSLHLEDWSLWLEQIRTNGWTRYTSASDLKKVDVSQVPSVPGTSWKVEVKGEGEQWSEPAKGPFDGCYYVKSSAPADSVRLAYTLDDPAPGQVFVNGETTTSFPMVYDDGQGVWYTTATEADIKAATKTGDSPKVMLGIVAQRYPWNGTLDIQYKTLYANASVIVTFYANGIKLGEAQGTGGQGATASFDLNAVPGGAFKDKKLKNVKITATIE